MTRGQRINTVCVITETNDIAEARDILDTIITIDRADTPATGQRQRLAKQDRRQPVRRCQIPDWFDELRTATVEQLDHATADHTRRQHQQRELQQRITAAEQRHHQALLAAEPHSHAVDEVDTVLARMRARRRSLARHLDTAKRRDRRSIRAKIATADHQLELADANRLEATRQARHTATAIANARTELNDLRQDQWREQLFARWTGGTETIDILHLRLRTLDTWQHWANGGNLDPNHIGQMAEAPHVTSDPTHRLSALHAALLTHPDTRAIHLSARPAIPVREPLNMTIELT